MSQFGTIGVPRMHPCVGWIPKLVDLESKYLEDKESNISQRTSNITENMLNEDQISEPKDKLTAHKYANSNIFENYQYDDEKKTKADHNISPTPFKKEANRRYVQVAPGVWSYGD